MFRIGDFSKLGQVSVRMLRHYDQFGLLNPDYTEGDCNHAIVSDQTKIVTQRLLDFL